MTNYRYQKTKGDSLVVELTYRVAETEDDPPVAVDLTGCEAVLAVKWPSGSVILSSEDGEITLGGVAGTIVCDAIDTSPLPVGEQTRYQLRLTDSLGLEKTLLAGSIRVEPSAVEDAT